MSQSQLLSQRRFWPFFVVSFLVAFNDNLLKTALVMLVTFNGLSFFGLEPGLLVMLITGVFIVPFMLFSALAGQVSDRVAKHKVVRWVKAAEVPVMGLGALGLLFENLPMMLIAVFLAGLQSTIFGPAKYSLLPEVLDGDELVGGNALIELGTFMAILIGTIVGSILVISNPAYVSITVLVAAFVGFGVSWLVPKTKAIVPDLVIDYNPVRPISKIMRQALENRPVFWSIIGLSWFWFMGAAFLSLLSTFGKEVLFVSPGVVTWFMVVFCAGIGLGSLAVERLSKGYLELGLVPIGALGMSLFAFDLFLSGGQPLGLVEAPLELGAFLQTFTGIRISLDLSLLAACGGLFTVPLYALMQLRSPEETRSQVFAANNVINALFMVASAALVAGLLATHVSIAHIFLVLAVLNTVAVAVICWVIPEFTLKMIVLIMCNLVYRLKIKNAPRIPTEGRAIVVANHPSFIDFMFLSCASRRPMRFVVWHTFYWTRGLHWIFKAGNGIPIASGKEDKVVLDQAYDAIAEALENDEVVCVFPEGAVSRDGELSTFRSGIEKILKRTPAPVIPVAVKGMWGSFFSWRWGKPMTKPFKRKLWASVEIDVGEEIPSEEATVQNLAKIIAKMGGWKVPSENTRPVKTKAQAA